MLSELLNQRVIRTTHTMQSCLGDQAAAAAGGQGAAERSARGGQGGPVRPAGRAAPGAAPGACRCEWGALRPGYDAQRPPPTHLLPGGHRGVWADPIICTVLL